MELLTIGNFPFQKIEVFQISEREATLRAGLN